MAAEAPVGKPLDCIHRRTSFCLLRFPKEELAIAAPTNLAGANSEEFIVKIARVFHPELRLVNGGGLSPAADRRRTTLVCDRVVIPEDSYSRLRHEQPGCEVSEDERNDWAGRLLGAERLDEALAVFTLNTRLHPASAKE